MSNLLPGDNEPGPLRPLPGSEPAEGAAGGGGGEFPTTRWSMVLQAGEGGGADAQLALETLCRQYWYPLYAFIRREGRSHHDAEDGTQEFLRRLLAAEGIARAHRERGRFRTFLLACLRNFLRQEWRRAVAEKRGGGTGLVSFDLPEGVEDRYAREFSDPSVNAEQAYDRAWALQLIDQAIARLRSEYERREEGPFFETAGPLLWGEPSPASHAACAATIGMTEHAFTVALQRLRRRLGERLREAVAETVPAGADVEAELRYLIAAAGDVSRSGAVGSESR